MTRRPKPELLHSLVIADVADRDESDLPAQRSVVRSRFDVLDQQIQRREAAAYLPMHLVDLHAPD